MNSLVLKPCLCVVFFTLIPKVAPSASGLRRCAGFATLARLGAAARVGCKGLRLAREEVFLAFRFMPVALFFERRRVLSATALRVGHTPLLTVPRKIPEKMKLHT